MILDKLNKFIVWKYIFVLSIPKTCVSYFVVGSSVVINEIGVVVGSSVVINGTGVVVGFFVVVVETVVVGGDNVVFEVGFGELQIW